MVLRFNFVSNVKQSIKRLNQTLAKTQYGMNGIIQVSDDIVSYAVKLLREGKVVALPTDTIYGLAADSLNPEAVSQLYKVKGRDFNKPVAICVSKVEDIKIWGKVDDIPITLLNELLPGPVTVLLRRTDNYNHYLNPDAQRVAVRIPKSNFVCKVVSSLGHGIALTSANSSDEPSTLSPLEFRHLWPELAAVFTAGVLGGSKTDRSGSTIVDLTTPGKFYITRDGCALVNTVEILKKHGLEAMN